MTRVEVDTAALHALEHSEAVRADLLHRAERVTGEASRRAREVSPSWAKTFDHEAGTDERGAYEDVSWRRTAGKGTGGGWRGEFFLFGTSEPNHPAHLDVLLGAIDEAQVTLPVVAVDAEGAVRDWCASLNIRATLQPQRSGAEYLLLSRAGGLQETAGRDNARITATAHSFKSKQAAANLAISFANAVWNLTQGVIAPGVYCTGAEVDSGPTEVPDPSGTSRYLVVTTFYLGPAGP